MYFYFRKMNYFELQTQQHKLDVISESKIAFLLFNTTFTV